MPKIPCRKFTLADIMILVGFTAGGLALGRPILDEHKNNPWWTAYPMCYGSALLEGWTIAHLILRLKLPRPTIRRVFRQPGAAASLVCVISMLVWSIYFVIEGIRGRFSGAWDLLAFPAVSIGPAVLGVWTCLIVTRTLRVESGWMDRIGVALGVGWILLMVDVFFEIIR